MLLGINKKGIAVGYINQIKMGKVNGIGVVGKNGLLIISRYGSRLMLGGVLTTKLLPKMHFPEFDEPGCPSDGRFYTEACPVNAIMADKKQVNIMHCLRYTAQTPNMSKLKVFLLGKYNPKEAARCMSLTSFDEHTLHPCSRCVAVCPYGDGKNNYAQPLRQ
jgi:epoxyqueuosine reductase QueG